MLEKDINPTSFHFDLYVACAFFMHGIELVQFIAICRYEKIKNNHEPECLRFDHRCIVSVNSGVTERILIFFNRFLAGK